MGNLCGTEKVEASNDKASATATTETNKASEAPVAENKYQRKARLSNEWLKLDIKTPSPRSVTRDELAKHVTADDCWTILHGKVYDITPYLAYHPGGKRELMKGAGKDCTEMFKKVHSYVQYESILAKCVIGVLVEEDDEAPKEKGEDKVES